MIAIVLPLAAANIAWVFYCLYLWEQIEYHIHKRKDAEEMYKHTDDKYAECDRDFRNMRNKYDELGEWLSTLPKSELVKVMRDRTE